MPDTRTLADWPESIYNRPDAAVVIPGRDAASGTVHGQTRPEYGLVPITPEQAAHVRAVLDATTHALQQAAARALPALKHFAEQLQAAMPGLKTATALKDEIARQNRAYLRHLHTHTHRRQKRRKTHR